MSDNIHELDAKFTEHLAYLYETAARKYGGFPEVDDIVQETMLAFWAKHRRGENIEYPKAFLASALHHKYNDMLRQKYKNSVVMYDIDESILADGQDDITSNTEEYASVRREIGRLLRIYREVTVRYYVHGKSVERIATELGIPKGTVLSRLSSARGQIKEGLQTMEKYSDVSFAPKNITIGIWGNPGLAREPFSLVNSPIEANILTLAYEKPASLKDIADTMGVPCAYIEPAAEKLIRGELLGKTGGGLVYTRCFMQKYEDSFGDIQAQEAFADKSAESVWSIAWKHLEVLTKRDAFAAMSEKQKATLLLFTIHQALSKCVTHAKPISESEPKSPPERPNGGKWLATATIYENGERRGNKYDSSGPIIVNYSASGDGKSTCQMFDCQSLFGDAHWAYDNFKYKFSLQSILRFYASLLPCDVTVDTALICELASEFEALHIMHKNEQGKLVLDIPALPFEEVEVWNPVTVALQKELDNLLDAPLHSIWLSHKNRVPKHIDCAEYYRHTSALGAYVKAQLVAVVKKGLLPYHVEIGKTPLIYVAYRKKKRSRSVTSN